jgi:hypothetical protein
MWSMRLVPRQSETHVPLGQFAHDGIPETSGRDCDPEPANQETSAARLNDSEREALDAKPHPP